MTYKVINSTDRSLIGYKTCDKDVLQKNNTICLNKEGHTIYFDIVWKRGQRYGNSNNNIVLKKL
jgi:hypothetical protein